MRGLRLIEQCRGQVAYIEVDRVAEQQQLHGRNADDHRERKAVAAQLTQLLDHDREQAAQVHGVSLGGADAVESRAGGGRSPGSPFLDPRSPPFSVAATNTSSRFGATFCRCASISAARNLS